MKNKLVISILIIIFYSTLLYADILDSSSWNSSGNIIHYSNENIDIGKTSIGKDDNKYIFSSGYKKQPAGIIYIPMEIAKKGVSFKISNFYNIGNTINFNSWTPAFCSPFYYSGTWLQRYKQDEINNNEQYHTTVILYMDVENEENNFNEVTLQKKSDLDKVYTIGTEGTNDIVVSSSATGWLKLNLSIKTMRYKETPGKDIRPYTNNPYMNFPWRGAVLNLSGILDTCVNFDFYDYGQILFHYYHHSKNSYWVSGDGVPSTNINLSIYDRKYDILTSSFDITLLNFKNNAPLDEINKVHSIAVEHNYYGTYNSNIAPNVLFSINYDGKLKNISNANSTLDYTLYLKNNTNTYSINKNIYASNSNWLQYSISPEFGPNTNNFSSVTKYKRADMDIHVKLDPGLNVKELLSGKFKGTVNYKLTVN